MVRTGSRRSELKRWGDRSTAAEMRITKASGLINITDVVSYFSILNFIF